MGISDAEDRAEISEWIDGAMEDVRGRIDE